MKWGSDDDVRAFSWAEIDVVDEIDADLPDGFSEERYETKIATLREAESRLHWLQRRSWYVSRKARKW